MMPIDFAYYRPGSAEEAAACFAEADAAGMAPVYFGGGTEIITMARMDNIKTGAVIDIKGIPECSSLEADSGGRIRIGAAVPLADIAESGCFPLLGSTVARIADHTSQYKITLGGNIAGTVIFRESSLPLLLTDCKTEIIGLGGRRTALFADLLDKRVRLERGEFMLYFELDGRYAGLPHVHYKKTKYEKIDYPLLTVAALKDGGRVCTAFSGLCGYPFRSMEMEDALNKPALGRGERAKKAAAALPEPAIDDISAASDYRIFVLEKTLEDVLTVLEA